MYVDDGDKERKLRGKIINAAFRCMAVDFADHPVYDKLGYVAFCNDYVNADAKESAAAGQKKEAAQV